MSGLMIAQGLTIVLLGAILSVAVAAALELTKLHRLVDTITSEARRVKAGLYERRDQS